MDMIYLPNWSLVYYCDFCNLYFSIDASGSLTEISNPLEKEEIYENTSSL
jgi:hypothetical protein